MEQMEVENVGPEAATEDSDKVTIMEIAKEILKLGEGHSIGHAKWMVEKLTPYANGDFVLGEVDYPFLLRTLANIGRIGHQEFDQYSVQLQKIQERYHPNG